MGISSKQLAASRKTNLFIMVPPSFEPNFFIIALSEFKSFSSFLVSKLTSIK